MKGREEKERDLRERERYEGKGRDLREREAASKRAHRGPSVPSEGRFFLIPSTRL